MACAATARLGALGLLAGAAEVGCSLNPADYVYPAPTEAQLQRLLPAAGQGGVIGCSVGPVRQPATRGLKANGFGAGGALQGAAPSAAAAAAVAAAKAAGAAAHDLLDDFFGGQLELDDDCLRLLLGEDADETVGPCASAAGSGKGAACGSGGSGASQKSSATAGEAAGAAAGAGDAEAASLPDAGTAAAAAVATVPFKHEEEDDIAMLFGEYRAEPLDPLHLLGTAHLAVAAADDDDTSSAAGGGSGADGDCDSPKRAKPSAGCSPGASGLHLNLSMDYVKAAESINLELLGAGGAQRKAAACASDGFGAMLPLLSPIMEFATLSGGLSYAGEGSGSGAACNSYGGGPAGADTPESPDSLASSDMTPMPPLGTMQRQESTKRKRAVRL